MIPVTSSFEMEKQVQSANTISKFQEFQNELNSQMCCRIVSTRKEDTTLVYEIKEHIMFGEEKNVIFTVLYNSDEVENDVELLPEKYILRRWRKDVRRAHTRIHR
ncbi:hypothetical protein BVC80_1417g3 [Macleaya cordata]|uniref:Protein FAR1-RELATED SEQUENCE n=1 Tax=Macleaya cordata TaxID=56857 RepID=A0A200Q5D5_MACCD|nr:hypothetical protein BVC80_1417g3 [Macleaya cordata]